MLMEGVRGKKITVNFFYGCPFVCVVRKGLDIFCLARGCSSSLRDSIVSKSVIQNRHDSLPEPSFLNATQSETASNPKKEI